MYQSLGDYMIIKQSPYDFASIGHHSGAVDLLDVTKTRDQSFAFSVAIETCPQAHWYARQKSKYS